MGTISTILLKNVRKSVGTDFSISFLATTEILLTVMGAAQSAKSKRTMPVSTVV